MAGDQQLGDIGARLPLLIREGTTFGPVTITLRQPAQQPVDLTGAEVRGGIRRRQSDTTVLVSFQTRITKPTLGEFAFGLSSAETRLLAVDRSYNPLKLVYDLELVDAAGNVRPILYGDVTLHLGGRHGG